MNCENIIGSDTKRKVTHVNKGFWYKVKKYKILLLMLAPTVLNYLIFHYLPMFGVLLAFKTYDFKLGILDSPWVGFDNFKFFFVSGQAFRVTRNTLLYNATFITIDTITQIFTAIILSELGNKYFKKIMQTMMFMPYFISWVVVGAFIYNIFNFDYGLFNSVLKYFGLEPINAYSTPWIWKYILVFFKNWKGIGYGSVVYLAAITGIDSEMYEAAEIDGANIWKRIRHITIPCLIPTVIVLTLLALGGIFRGDFAMFYQIVGENGLLYNATDVIDTFAFRSLMRTNEFGMASAVGLYQSVLCFSLVMIVNYVVRRVDKDSALF